MCLFSSEILKANQDWLAKVTPDLASRLDADLIKKVTFRQNAENNDFNLFFLEERVLEACNQSISSAFLKQIDDTDGVSVPRIMRLKSDSAPSEGVLAEMVNRHHEVFLDHLPSVPVAPSDQNYLENKPRYRNLFVFGSLMLLPLLSYLQDNPDAHWISITLVEDDFRQLISTFSFFACFLAV